MNIVGIGGNPDVVLYKATADSGSSVTVCRVTRETAPLHCQLVGLTPGTPYVISVRSCLLGDACGEPLKKNLRIKQNGELSLTPVSTHEAPEITVYRGRKQPVKIYR